MSDFSEDASKFLAQSQSRLSFAGNERQVPDRSRRQNNPSGWRPSAGSKPYLSRIGNPYQPSASQALGFPFSSRLNPQQAPLFYSATDEFRETNDEEEHEKELADYYALQKSRRQLGGKELEESSEVEDEGSRSLGASEDGRETDGRGFGTGGGIRSSWRGDHTSGRGRGKEVDRMPGQLEGDANDGRSEGSSRSRGKMVDVGLESTIRSEAEDDEPPHDYMDNPPSIQHFRKTPRDPSAAFGIDSAIFPQETDRQTLLDHPRPPSSSGDSVPAPMARTTAEPPRHDAFWGHLYLLCLAATFATWFLVYLHTEAPSTKRPLGDTIYTTLHASFHLLAIYTLVSIFVSLLWLAALRSYVRLVVYAILISVPVILYSFSLYSFISSFKGSWHGSSIQDTVMRCMALIPTVLGTLWIFSLIRGRHSLHKAISILEFATRILAANTALLAQGFGVLAAIVSWTWVWLSMFTRVFLGGHLSSRSSVGRFVIDASTWWLGVYFILMYLWTIAMIFGIQRSVTSATVSQWYFHRLAIPAPTSLTIVQAALNHALTTLFGTIALSTGLSLLIRMPLLILPRRITFLLSAATYSFIPTPVAALINPLTLTYASIHSQPLTTSARGLSQLQYLAPTTINAVATTSLYPNTFAARPYGRNGPDGWASDNSSLLPYRLSKLLLHATRLIMSLALGFGGWVSTARSLNLKTSTSGSGSGSIRGSLYAYIVGLIAGAIGWGILGAMEGVVAGVVDAVVVCWGSEVGNSVRAGGGRGEARYCREAGWLFGEDEGEGEAVRDTERGRGRGEIGLP
jgi:Plasma-membrane choline transporter